MGDMAAAFGNGPFTGGGGDYSQGLYNPNAPDWSGVHKSGQLGGFDVGQIDVRTQLMRSLEGALAPLLFTALLNPGKLAQTIGGMSGPVPGQEALDAPTNAGNTMLSQSGINAMSSQPQQDSAASALQQLFSAGPQHPAFTDAGHGPHLFNGTPVNTQQPSAYPPPFQAPQLPDRMQYAQPAAPPPAGMQNPNGAGSPYMPAATVGTTAGGQQIPFGAEVPSQPQANGLDQRIAALLGRYGSADAALNTNGLNDIAGIFGVQPYQVARGGIPGWGSLGNELNTGVLNAQLLPQGYLASMGGGNTLNVLKPGGQQVGSAGNQDMLQQLLGSMGIQFRAQGGLLDPNAFTIVGENGPELIPPGNNSVMPLQGANIGGLGQMPQMPQLPQIGGFQPSALQGAGTGSAMRLLESNPEMQAFQAGKDALGVGNPGQGVVNALQPAFQQNLQHAMTQLRGAAPSVFGTGFAQGNFDLARQGLNDFNVTAANALLQGNAQQGQNASIMGQLASAAGQNPFQRALAAAQQGTEQSQAQTGADQQAQSMNAQLALQGGAQQQNAALSQRGQDINALLGLGNLGLGAYQAQGQLGLGQQAQTLQQQLGLGMLPYQQQLAGAQAGATQAGTQQTQAQTGLLGPQFQLQQQLGLGQLGLQQQQLPAQIALMLAQAQNAGAGGSLQNAQATSMLGMLPYQQEQMQAQTGDIGAARQQAGQQISNQYNLGVGGLANDNMLGLRNQDIQQMLALAQMAQQQQQFGSQFGLQQQQQSYNQTMAPTLQLLLAAMGMAQPTAMQTLIPGKA